MTSGQHSMQHEERVNDVLSSYSCRPKDFRSKGLRRRVMDGFCSVATAETPAGMETLVAGANLGYSL